MQNEICFTWKNLLMKRFEENLMRKRNGEREEKKESRQQGR